MFGWKDFTEMASAGDLHRIFEGPAHTRWRSFRQREESRYVGLTLPRILLRLPYGEKTTPVRTFSYREAAGAQRLNYLWGSAAYAFAQRLTRAVALHGWCAAIAGNEGGLVQGLPVHCYMTDEGRTAVACPTEVAVSGAYPVQLFRLGFISLSDWNGADQAVFLSAPSCMKPKVYDRDEVTSFAAYSAQLPYVLAVSRFAHYIRVIMRNATNSGVPRAELEQALNEWIGRYVLKEETSDQAALAKFPLREARIEVQESRPYPGSYAATAFLRPHFQLHDTGIPSRLVITWP
jgi:type VI secretion system protein ImpC